MAPVWKDTVVMVATEFGRTAAVNGTVGTDHGTGGMALLAVAFSVLALVLLSHASRESNVHTIERDWHRAHRCVIIAGVAFVLFAFGALWVAL